MKKIAWDKIIMVAVFILGIAANVVSENYVAMAWVMFASVLWLVNLSTQRLVDDLFEHSGDQAEYIANISKANRQLADKVFELESKKKGAKRASTNAPSNRKK